MAFSVHRTLGAVLGAACLAAIATPASSGTLSVTPAKDIALNAPVTEVHYRSRVRPARHVKVRRHYVGNRYYYRRHYNNAVPAAALGLFTGVLGAALASNYYDYDDYYYPTYGYGFGYPYSYGYSYPIYSYGYARPRYVYGGHRFYRHGGHWGGRHFVRGGFGGGRHFVRGGFGGGRHFVGGGGFGGGRHVVRGGFGGGRHFVGGGGRGFGGGHRR